MVAQAAPQVVRVVLGLPKQHGQVMIGRLVVDHLALSIGPYQSPVFEQSELVGYRRFRHSHQ